MFFFRFFFLFTFFFTPIFAQQNRFPFPKEDCIELLHPKLSKGFYLVHTKDIRQWCRATQTFLIKNLATDFYIVHATDHIIISDTINARYYKVPNSWKLSKTLGKKNIAETDDKLVVSTHVLNPDQFIENWSRKSPSSCIKKGFNNYLIIEMPTSDLEKLMYDQNTTYIGAYKRPHVESPNVDSDLSVNSINQVHNNYPNLNGEGVVVSVKELSFDTTDIDFKNRYFLTGLEAEEIDPHAALIATVIGGGGNSSGKGRGVVNAVTLTSSSFLNVFPDDELEFSVNNISVQNHSYGTTIENEYGNEAAAYDEIANTLPKLAHIFSSGNSGNQTSDEGMYSGIANYANLTGNFKHAKNIITVGAIRTNGELDERSSKGPAHDGRVKPELVSYAPGGTSDAAALVSGVAVLLQQTFANNHSGALPPSSLVKAALIAGTDDVGFQGIDFESGYGNLNAAQSVDLVMKNQFILDSVAQNTTKTVTITVPPETGLLKIALNWNDPAANPGSVRALTNDLDMVLTGTDANSWLPWVLDSDANVRSLVAPARRMEDHLNNTEFITVENPLPGNYTIAIRGTEIIGPQQSFAVAYDLVKTNHFEWIFPTSEDPIVVEDAPRTLRWQSTFPNTTGTIEINRNNEGWGPLADNIDLNAGFYEFLIEEDTAGTAQLRMIIANEIYLSDTFAFSKELIPQVLFNCDEEVLFGWQRVPNATTYNLHFLDERYMEVTQTVTDTTALIVKRDFSEAVFAVEPVFDDLIGTQGRALDYQLQEVSCYYIGFSANLIDQGVVNATLDLSTSINISTVVFEKMFNGEVLTITDFSPPFKNDLALESDDLNPNTGINTYRAIITLNNGNQIITNTVDVLVPSKNTLILFPNPVSQGENLNIFSEGNETDIQIVDFTGKVLVTERIETVTSSISINLISGIYILRILEDGKTKAAKKFYVN